MKNPAKLLLSLSFLPMLAGPALAQPATPPPMGIAINAPGAPKFQPEPFWPKPLPDNWILGQVAGIAVDGQDNIWIIHRPATLLDDEKGAQKIRRRPSAARPRRRCWSSTPKAICSPPGAAPAQGYDWLKNEHGIHVDRDGNVWLGGNNDGDQILKFTPDGKFLAADRQGRRHQGLATRTTRLGRPAHMMTDDAANELYVADGYGNQPRHRVRRQDRRLQAPLGRLRQARRATRRCRPTSPTRTPSEQFANPVHCVRLSNDGLVYVCDRANDRIQVFRKDGTFVKEFRVEPETLRTARCGTSCCRRTRRRNSSSWPTAPTARSSRSTATTGEVLTQWGRHGRQPGQFKWVHNIAIDSKGNLYTAEVGFGRRVQKFKRVE